MKKERGSHPKVGSGKTKCEDPRVGVRDRQQEGVEGMRASRMC